MGRAARRLLVIVLSATGASSTVPAQELRTPQFQIQPGFTLADFYSAADGVQSTTAFSIRFSTRFPTALAWLTPVVGASFTPYGSTGSTIRDTDAPTLFAGTVFTVTAASRSDWLTVEVPLLLVHSPGAGPSGNLRDYGRDLVVQPTAYLHLGRQLFREFGPLWSRFDVFTLIEQNLTPNRDGVTGRRDRLNPVFMAGASLTLGGPTPHK